MRLIAIDPSLRSSGFAVLEAEESGSGGGGLGGNAGFRTPKIRALAYGTIPNAAKLLPSACLVAIHERLTGLIQEFQPVCAAVEAVIYVQSHRTAITLGAARGAALLACAAKGLPVFEYAPTDVKQAVAGRGGAAKEQVAFMVRAVLGLTETPQADAADALAIGLTHLQNQASVLRGIKAVRQI